MHCGMVWCLLRQRYLDGCPLKGEVGSKLPVRCECLAFLSLAFQSIDKGSTSDAVSLV